MHYSIQKGGKSLSLCFHETGKQRKYKSVSHILSGKFAKSNWNDKKEQFYSSPNYEANNEAIFKFRKKYSDVLAENLTISQEELYNYFDRKRPDCTPIITIFDFLTTIIDEEKTKPNGGCNYKCYEKLEKRLYEFEPYLKKSAFKGMTFETLDDTFCKTFEKWIINERKGKDYESLIKLFTSLINRADISKSVKFDRSQIDKYAFASYSNNKGYKRPDILQPEEIKAFANLDLATVQGKYTMDKVQLFHDTCMLMMGTFMRPCDVVLFKKEDIIADSSNKRTVSYIPKKKASLPNKSKRKYAHCPLVPEVEGIINKYAGKSDDGYVLPLYSEVRAQGLKDGKEGLLKQINRDLNKWLKKVAEVMGLKIVLNAYVFRSTSISHALSFGKTPIATVAQWAGTSVGMIEKHYFNGCMDNNLPSAISGLYFANNYQSLAV